MCLECFNQFQRSRVLNANHPFLMAEKLIKLNIDAINSLIAAAVAAIYSIRTKQPISGQHKRKSMLLLYLYIL